MIKNKVELKKTFIISLCVIIIFSILSTGIAIYQYKLSQENYNAKINSLINELLNEYPQLDSENIVEILNNNDKINNNSKTDFLKIYGIDIEKDAVILANKIVLKNYLILNALVTLLFGISLIIVYLRYNSKKDKKLREITRYLEGLNNKNYKLDIEDNTEGELSILKNEIYKTTVMLNEVAENSIKDKAMLKDSLSDISHQLKTPLTAISIMLDNIQDTPNMEENIRNEFIKDIKREIINISFLVNSLLKISKLDSLSVQFIYKEVEVQDILNNAIKNVEVLCDLKNINIQIENEDAPRVTCDFAWQVEAVTNIIKNCVEHSEDNSKIEIRVKKYNVYIAIEIQDYGSGISKKDLPHVFERFYKGENASSDSIGIGLALAKSIIESNNGNIDVKSEKQKGTTFIIKYFIQ